ncbi:MAG: molybdopterin-dependent oxidoreductase [Deltaproteobacteria bacterium]|nr:molybdopterin-dependent oxidoreductase [Deltaproteobacteria bacterium]
MSAIPAVTQPSVCTLDCPDTCSLAVTVENHRITAVRGSKANPFTNGVICAKVTHSVPDFVHGPRRLRTPLLRTGKKGEGRFQPISWEEALDRTHEGLSRVIERFGTEAVVPLNYAGPHGMLAYASMDRRFFNRLGASRLHRGSLCGGVRTEAYASLFGAAPGMNPEQVEEAQLVVAWGNNVTVSNLHLMPVINRAKSKGARLVVVDPRRTKAAEQADLHVPLRPGTDLPLAFALAVELERRGGLDHKFIAQNVQGFEAYMERARQFPPEEAARICGVAAEDIRKLAQWYHQAAPAAISMGNGPERSLNGGNGIRAVFALPALAGKFGVRGGGLVNGAGFAFPKTPLLLERPGLAPRQTRLLNIVDVAAHVLDESLEPPVRALFIYSHNPLVVHPHQNRVRRALEHKEVFIVGCDVTLTDSLAYADIVLPACTAFESHDLYPAYGQHWLQRAEPVIPPVGESLPLTEIFRRLAKRFGFDAPEFHADDAALMDDALDAGDARLGGRKPSRLPAGEATPMRTGGEEFILYKNHGPRTPSGKVELHSPDLEERYGLGVPAWQPVPARHTFTLISPASALRISSTFGGLPGSDATPSLEMHPQDAARLGLFDGSLVRVWNEQGQVFLTLDITDRVPQGVVSSEKGAWIRTSPNGQTVAALAPPHHADLCGGACYNDAQVEVAAAPLGSEDGM